MKNKKLIIITCIILLVVFIGIGYSITNNKKNQEKTHISKTKEEKDDQVSNTKEFKDEYGDKDTVKIKYDQYVVASGYMGASDNVYYTRDNVLYHLVISSNETTKVAEGIKKIEGSRDGLNAYKGEGFKILEEDNYINYID